MYDRWRDCFASWKNTRRRKKPRKETRKQGILFRAWTSAEVDILRQAPPEMSTTALALSVGRSVVSVQRKLCELSLTRNPHLRGRKHSINDLAFLDWNEHSAYWMGFIAADGCLKTPRNNSRAIVVALATKDVGHLLMLRDFLQASHPIYTSTQGRVSLCVSSETIWDALVAVGITPNKSLSLGFPPIPLKWVHHFMRGYFDGDGSAGCSKSGEPFFSLLGTHNFLSGAASHFPIPDVSITKRKDCRIHRIQVHCSRAKAVAKWLYCDATVFLPRKRDKVIAWLD